MNTIETPREIKLVIPSKLFKTIKKEDDKKDLIIIETTDKESEIETVKQNYEQLNDSGDIDLLSYNDYIANAKMAKEYRHQLGKSGKVTPLNR